MKNDSNIKFIELEDFLEPLKSWYNRDYKEYLDKGFLKNIVKKYVYENGNGISCAIRFVF
jgi:hypothetical protein